MTGDSSSADVSAEGGAARSSRSPLRRAIEGWRLSDGVILIATLIIAGGALRESLRDHDLMTRLGPGAGMFPMIVTSAALFLMLLFVLQGSTRAVTASWPDADGRRRILLTVLATSLIPTLSGYLGLLTASMLLIAFVLFGVLRAKVIPSLVTLFLTGGLAYMIFFRLLINPMPRGPWGYF